MRKLILLFVFLPFFSLAQVSPEEVVAVVQKQLEAYNQRDLERFTALFHDDAELFNLGETSPIARGKEQLTEIYKRLFESSPNLRSDVVSRQVIGNKVLDYEIITGRQNQTDPVYLIAVYEIEDSKIKRCYFIRQ
ncbi:MAG: nuclear transport factor 2 family protein [Schleiferiaceae bacterium]|nr:nuclear transport factor 2 family protein [Schleiferiaceae bacterium]